jgi:hypothetical protein
MILSVSKKSETLITLVVRRGALRRFHKLQKETADLPVVVTWDRRSGDHPDATPGDGSESAPEDRRRQQSFTWELADFIVVPGEPQEAPAQADDSDQQVEDQPNSRAR